MLIRSAAEVELEHLLHQPIYNQKQPSGTHWIERFMNPVLVWSGSKMKEKPQCPLAFEPLTAQA
jgi:hypothetical protein